MSRNSTTGFVLASTFSKAAQIAFGTREEVLSEQMIQKDFKPHGYEYCAAEEFSLRLILSAENTASFDAEQAAGECCNADKGNCRDDIDLQKGERNADGQRIDACSHSERNHSRGGKIVITGFILFLARFADHVEADEAEQRKSDIGRNGSDQRLKLRPENVTNQRHGSLKHTEIESANQHVPNAAVPHG